MIGDDPDEAELDRVLWRVWRAVELPEGYRAEIIEGALEVQRIGRVRHAGIVNRLRRALSESEMGDESGAFQGLAVVHRRSVWIPDLVIARLDAGADSEDIGVLASAVHLVAEVVSRGERHQDRDRVKKRRAYARADIPVYVIIDDYDGQGSVTVLTDPRPDKADWGGIHRVPYGTDITIPKGPAKGFVIGEAITGPKRA
ncbi:Uma2 family endonuclease [Streptomyces sp. SA15]|uniref:Uma2 family endonuclease n=1 Tax=Streptomyces sp. SA15 TaxID=934019 RepID=UPI00211C9904|nr:Uma2 family endonuclease [Streptomyces sp. SA15]